MKVPPFFDNREMQPYLYHKFGEIEIYKIVHKKPFYSKSSPAWCWVYCDSNEKTAFLTETQAVNYIKQTSEFEKPELIIDSPF